MAPMSANMLVALLDVALAPYRDAPAPLPRMPRVGHPVRRHVDA
jgi:hypothetical protein